jgi:urease accessory protein UreF
MTVSPATGCLSTCAGTPWPRSGVAHAYRLAAGAGTAADRLTALVEHDHLLAAYKVPRELRQESQHTGQAFLRAAMALCLRRWYRLSGNKACGATPGHALVFGPVAQGRLDPESTLLAYLYTVLAGLVAGPAPVP